MARKLRTKPARPASARKEFVDHIVEGQRGVKDLWKLMNISNDRFIRTTDDYHVAAHSENLPQNVRQGRHL